MVVVTGGCGLVGRSVVMQLLADGEAVTLFDRFDLASIRRAYRRLRAEIRRRLGRERLRDLTPFTGDLCNIADVGECMKRADVVVHLGAMIPPAADHSPIGADYVNRGGTRNVVEAIERLRPGARFIFTSSIAVYGDRRHRPQILPDDPLRPNGDDVYANQKVAAEAIVRASRLNWLIFRLTYIVSPEKLKMDPLMFHMPLDTSIEVCSAADAGYAIAKAAESTRPAGRALHLSGGASCRTNYRDYLNRMTRLFGLGRNGLPAEAFGNDPFHCGFMESGEAEKCFHFQRESLEAYYEKVGRAVRLKRFVVTLLRPVVRLLIVRRSPFYRERLRSRFPGRSGWLGARTRAHQLG